MPSRQLVASVAVRFAPELKAGSMSILLPLGLNLTGNSVDDPDQSFYENYSCDSERNYTNYCNKDIEKLFDQQSMETDIAKRKKLVWEIDKKLQEDVARPIIFHARTGTCWQPYVKGVTIMVNSSYNGYRYEDVWLDK